MTPTPVFVGLDVAKATLDVALRPSGEQWQVPNDEAGVAVLVDRLRPLGPALVVCEATGGFERDRKSTRLNSSHQIISYAVFCLKKKKKKHSSRTQQE